MVVDLASPFIDIKVKAGAWSMGPAEGSSRRRTSKTAGEQRNEKGYFGIDASRSPSAASWSLEWTTV